MKLKVITIIYIIVAVLFLGLMNGNEVNATEIQVDDSKKEEEKEEIIVDTELYFDADAALNRTAAKSALADMQERIILVD